MIETEACDNGVGAVLIQGGRLLAYISQALAAKHRGMSVYEKELLAMIIAIDKWRHYLEGT